MVKLNNVYKSVKSVCAVHFLNYVNSFQIKGRTWFLCKTLSCCMSNIMLIIKQNCLNLTWISSSTWKGLLKTTVIYQKLRQLKYFSKIFLQVSHFTCTVGSKQGMDRKLNISSQKHIKFHIKSIKSSLGLITISLSSYLLTTPIP